MTLRTAVATIKIREPNRSTEEFKIAKVQDFTVDSSIDTDSDSFSFTFGDPELQFIDIRKPHAEMFCRLSIYDAETAEFYNIVTGFGDSLQHTSDNRFRIIGRDISSAATDNDSPPGYWRNIRPHKLIESESATMGFTGYQLAEISPIEEFYTDGSETVWEKWYRMYRLNAMWLWTDSIGNLIANSLNFNTLPRYFFGTPKSINQPVFSLVRGSPSVGRKVQVDWINVLNAELIKDISNRKHEVWVFGENDHGGLFSKRQDNSIQDWQRKNLKIINDPTLNTRISVRDEARNELFEGNVGSRELRLRVEDPSEIIFQNNMAWVHLPDMDIDSAWYVVGTRIIGNSTSGFQQEIRLRGTNYALSRRIPRAPELRSIEDQLDEVGFSSPIARALTGLPEGYGEHFVVAAKTYLPVNTSYDLFLATLLAIGKHESGFRNVREGGTTEWFPQPISVVPIGPEHSRLFANNAENSLTPLYRGIKREAGVGIMQLTSRSFKNKADELANLIGEYDGGRWRPEYNIKAGAYALQQKINQFPPGVANFWLGVQAYNGSGIRAEAYKNTIKNRVEEEDGWLSVVKDALDDARSTRRVISGDSPLSYTIDGIDVNIPGATPYRIKLAINFAIDKVQRDIPYKWGGESIAEGGFDCSGLVWAAYNSAQVTFTRSTSQRMWSRFGEFDWKIIFKNQLLPGDLLFFNGIEPSHMGMYVGNGNMVHARSTSHGLRVDSIEAMGANSYRGARRVVTWPVSPSLAGRSDALDYVRTYGGGR